MREKDRHLIAERLNAGDKISVPSFPDVAYAKLRDAIVTGKLAGGEPLRQEDLADALGISRFPIREALARLEGQGLVVQRPRRGYFVASLDTDEVEDVFELRAILEERAGYLAAKHRTPADIAAVEEILTRMEKWSVEDVHQFADENHNFHARLFESSKRKHLCRTLIALGSIVDRYVRISATFSRDFDRARKDHRKMFDAFRAGNPDRLGQLSRQHVETTAKELLLSLRSARAKER